MLLVMCNFPKFYLIEINLLMMKWWITSTYHFAHRH